MPDRHITQDEALALMPDSRDIADLLMYFTIRLPDGRSVQKSGRDRYTLRDPNAEDIPGSVIEEWFAS